MHLATASQLLISVKNIKPAVSTFIGSVTVDVFATDKTTLGGACAVHTLRYQFASSAPAPTTSK
jgi:hypothetical protein